MESTLNRLTRIKVDALYGKKKHFNAADRIQRYHYSLGIPLVVVNILTGSVLVYVLTENDTNWVRYVPLVLAFGASLLGGLQTFFNFPRKVEGHRRLGNRYLSIMKRCDRLQAYVNDSIIEEKKFIEELEAIASEVDSINQDSEALPTSTEDYEKARQGIESGEEDYTAKELEV